jgi:hypothetical protein
MDIDDMIGKNATKIIVAGGRDFDDYGRMVRC